MVPGTWPFIELDERGIAFVQGTRTRVTEIAECHLAYRWDAEQIHRQLTGLTLPKIHAALGYYYEHKMECDQQMRDAEKMTELLRVHHENADLKKRLKRLQSNE